MKVGFDRSFIIQLGHIKIIHSQVSKASITPNSDERAINVISNN